MNQPKNEIKVTRGIGFMIIAVTFFFSSQSPRGTVGCKEGTSVETTEGIHEMFKKLAGMEKKLLRISFDM